MKISQIKPNCINLNYIKIYNFLILFCLIFCSGCTFSASPEYSDGGRWIIHNYLSVTGKYELIFKYILKEKLRDKFFFKNLPKGSFVVGIKFENEVCYQKYKENTIHFSLKENEAEIISATSPIEEMTWAKEQESKSTYIRLYGYYQDCNLNQCRNINDHGSYFNSNPESHYELFFETTPPNLYSSYSTVCNIIFSISHVSD